MQASDDKKRNISYFEEYFEEKAAALMATYWFGP